MDTLNSVESTNGAEDAIAQKDGKKRISYVARDHKTMVEFIGLVYKNLGHSEYHSNKAIATIHQMSPDSIKPHLTSAQQYRLLEIKHGTGYKITDLFRRIYLPPVEEVKTNKTESNDTDTVNDPGVKMIDIIIPLKTSKNKAVLSIPEDYTDADLIRINKFVSALKNEEEKISPLQ